MKPQRLRNEASIRQGRLLILALLSSVVLCSCGSSCAVTTSLGIVTGGIYSESSGPESLEDNADNIICEFKQLGVQWIRVEVDWPGTSNATYQSIVQLAHANNIKVNALLSTRYCGNDNDTAAIDTFTKMYVDQLSSLVENVFFGDYEVDAYEIGNELNQFENGCGDGIERFRVSPNAFAWLMRRVYQWKQRNNYNVLIVSGGLISTYTNESFWPSFWSSAALSAFTGFPPWDLFGIHPYNPFSLDENCLDSDPNGDGFQCFAPWTLSITSGLQAIYRLANAATGVTNTTLFVTEWGLQTSQYCAPNTNCVVSQLQQLTGFQLSFDAIQASGVVTAALWYDYRDDSEQYFGIRSEWNGNEYPPKAMWATFQTAGGGTGNNPDNCWG